MSGTVCGAFSLQVIDSKNSHAELHVTNRFSLQLSADLWIRKSRPQ